MNSPVELSKRKRCDRNRKRSKRRAIYCPIHGCYMDSVSPKYPLYAETVAELREVGIPRKSALLMVAAQGTVPLTNQWLEAFWCEVCQCRDWYLVLKRDQIYEVQKAPQLVWQRATGMIDLENHPGVGEFTFRNANRQDRKYYDPC